MKTIVKHVARVSMLILILAGISQAQTLTPAQKTKVEAKLKDLKALSTDPKVVAAVRAINANPLADTKSMTNEKWKGLTVLDPTVRSFSKNDLAMYLKSKKDDSVTEEFVSAADGTKVAFLSKTTSWTHKGKDKHEVPMKGQTWIGPVELDESTGQQQVQIALPVIDAGKPIGSIVIGIGINSLK